MKCEICSDNEATVRYTEVVDNQIVKMNLCEVCAEKKGVTIQTPFSIADLLAGLTDLGLRQEENIDTDCPGCGLSYRDFRKTGRLGCDRCYDAFEKGLNALIEAVHKSTRHAGKIPVRGGSGLGEMNAIRELEDRLRSAVTKEEFEKAAQLRDRIQEMRKGKGSNGN